ncbi:hypothetical protein Patl1_28500 [Pistacia atlantica]|uniref:Uncharacterized protein n=1 Tax=Pistacia atlantica TaxID=434234 RepID=A0ACC1BGK7_9ROSI|nr:hypothetical protein Patl1_28500 [Pistacia atlantica]
MGTTSFRSFHFIIWVLFVAFSIFHPIVSTNQLSIVIGQSTSLLVTPSLAVENSPGLKPGTKVACERVDIRGLSRLHDLKEVCSLSEAYDSNIIFLLLRSLPFLCRNASLGVGMCPHGRWEKVSKGSWFKSMSPFDHKILDIRMARSSLETVEVAIEEGKIFQE